MGLFWRIRRSVDKKCNWELPTSGASILPSEPFSQSNQPTHVRIDATACHDYRSPNPQQSFTVQQAQVATLEKDLLAVNEYPARIFHESFFKSVLSVVASLPVVFSLDKLGLLSKDVGLLVFFAVASTCALFHNKRKLNDVESMRDRVKSGAYDLLERGVHPEFQMRLCSVATSGPPWGINSRGLSGTHEVESALLKTSSVNSKVAQRFLCNNLCFFVTAQTSQYAFDILKNATNLHDEMINLLLDKVPASCIRQLIDSAATAHMRSRIAALAGFPDLSAKAESCETADFYFLS